MMDNESSYWDQYDAYEMDQSLPVAQPLPPQLQLGPRVEEFRYAPYLSSCSLSSQDSYWSRHLGTRPTSTNHQSTPSNIDSFHQTHTSPSSSNLRRLLVVPEKLAALSLDVSASGDSSDSGCDSGCDTNEYNSKCRDDDDATLVVVSATTPPPPRLSLLLQPAGVKNSNQFPAGKHCQVDLKPLSISGRSQSDRRCADSDVPKKASIVDPADRTPPSSPGLCFAGVNANALRTRLTYLKDQMEQDELLMSLVV
ncbi:hypothetical protein GGI20_002883 [Coemansia sp. BCRC 34301]|nr:hypothetical protein GGI20_002883 [Coemansia sp. BCRC 34301]